MNIKFWCEIMQKKVNSFKIILPYIMECTICICIYWNTSKQLPIIVQRLLPLSTKITKTKNHNSDNYHHIKQEHSYGATTQLLLMQSRTLWDRAENSTHTMRTQMNGTAQKAELETYQKQQFMFILFSVAGEVSCSALRSVTFVWES